MRQKWWVPFLFCLRALMPKWTPLELHQVILHICRTTRTLYGEELELLIAQANDSWQQRQPLV